MFGAFATAVARYEKNGCAATGPIRLAAHPAEAANSDCHPRRNAFAQDQAAPSMPRIVDLTLPVVTGMAPAEEVMLDQTSSQLDEQQSDGQVLGTIYAAEEEVR